MWFTNESPAPRACWHPVAYRRELEERGGPVRVELPGEAWAVALAERPPTTGPWRPPLGPAAPAAEAPPPASGVRSPVPA